MNLPLDVILVRPRPGRQLLSLNPAGGCFMQYFSLVDFLLTGYSSIISASLPITKVYDDPGAADPIWCCPGSPLIAHFFNKKVLIQPQSVLL